MDILFTQKGFLFKGKADELFLYLDHVSQNYHTLKEFIEANLN